MMSKNLNDNCIHTTNLNQQQLDADLMDYPFCDNPTTGLSHSQNNSDVPNTDKEIRIPSNNNNNHLIINQLQEHTSCYFNIGCLNIQGKWIEKSSNIISYMYSQDLDILFIS